MLEEALSFIYPISNVTHTQFSYFMKISLNGFVFTNRKIKKINIIDKIGYFRLIQRPK